MNNDYIMNYWHDTEHGGDWDVYSGKTWNNKEEAFAFAKQFSEENKCMTEIVYAPEDDIDTNEVVARFVDANEIPIKFLYE